MWPGMHLAHNSAKLKIFNLPKHIQLLRLGLAASAGHMGRLPSDPLVGELLWLTDQRSDEGPDIKRRCVSTLWLGRLAPVFISMAGAVEAVAGPPAGFGLWRRGDSNS